MRMRLKKLIAATFLFLLTGSVISKDLYHLILPHQHVSQAYADHLTNPHASICNEQQSTECNLCHYDFSAGQAANTESLNSIYLPSCPVLIPTAENTLRKICILNESLRAPPSVI